MADPACLVVAAVERRRLLAVKVAVQLGLVLVMPPRCPGCLVLTKTVLVQTPEPAVALCREAK